MKMKKNFESYLSFCKLALVILLFLSIGSCEKFFKPEEFYLSNIDSKEELDNAVAGIIDIIKLQDWYSNTYIDFFGDDLYMHLANNNDPPSPDQQTNCYYSYYGVNECVKGRENGLLVYDWNALYSAIASINNVLSQFELKAVKGPGTKEMLGECLFYRAWCNYRLTRIYGRIPIIDNPDVDYTLPRPSYSKIYEFIESDLLKAIESLPANNITSRIPYESPNRGIAKALLGEVYLSWAGFPAKDETKYILSAKITEELMDSASYYGYELLSDFEDLWNKKSFYNNEAILCNYSKRPYNLFGNSNDYIYTGHSVPISSSNQWIQIGIDEKTKLWLRINPIPEIEFYNNYPKGYRKDITFFTRIYVYPLSYKPKLDTGYFYIDKTSCNSRAAYRKFYIDTLLSPPRYERDYIYYDLLGCPRVYLLRYAQTLLTFAEASARSGNLNEKSYECINKIRRRANKLPLDSPSPYDLTPGLSPEAFADSVAQERAWELAGEPGHRWFDMVRLGIVEKVYESRDPDDGGPFKYTENDKYFFPIPEHDINLNPNLGE
jgi:starch-binding outer membrane protein, SusD/RagB family